MQRARGLIEVLDEAWSMLARGVDDPADDLHWPVLASVGRAADAHASGSTAATGSDSDAGPPGERAFADARTVVLRASSPETRSVAVHSDAQAGKVAQLRACPAAALVAYHRVRRVQLRLHGTAQVHVDDDVTAATWASLPEHSRALYAGPQRLCLIRLHIRRLDWLHIGPERQLRAAFEFDTQGPPNGRWIDP
jgi:hypothetical protein